MRATHRSSARIGQPVMPAELCGFSVFLRGLDHPGRGTVLCSRRSDRLRRHHRLLLSRRFHFSQRPRPLLVQYPPRAAVEARQQPRAPERVQGRP
jgi:hypothetical protein